MERDRGSSRRTYRSDLRAAQAAATRQRILDAVAALVRESPDRMSIAGVARAAKVSLPTVHRHFPTRRDLFEAFRLRIEGSRADTPATDPTPTTLAAITPLVREFFRRFDDPKDPIGAMRRLRHSMAWEFSREVTVPRRAAWAKRIIAAELPGLRPADRARVSDLFVILVSASMGEALRGYLDRSAADMADRVTWALEAVFSHARQRATSARRSTRSSRTHKGGHR